MAQKENLKALLAQGRLKPHKASPEEIQNLFAVSERDLEDADVTGISDDRRFTIAYNAALQAARAILAAEGYRTSGSGHHATAFHALRGVLPKEQHHVLDYLDDCRSKRNMAEYTGTDIASEQEVAELVEQAADFVKLAHAFISQYHPNLVKK